MIFRTVVNEKDPICCYFDIENSKYVVNTFHGKETAYVNNVRLCPGPQSTESKRVCITFRLPVKIIFKS